MKGSYSVVLLSHFVTWRGPKFCCITPHYANLLVSISHPERAKMPKPKAPFLAIRDGKKTLTSGFPFAPSHLSSIMGLDIVLNIIGPIPFNLAPSLNSPNMIRKKICFLNCNFTSTFLSILKENILIKVVL